MYYKTNFSKKKYFGNFVVVKELMYKKIFFLALDFFRQKNE